MKKHTASKFISFLLTTALLAAVSGAAQAATQAVNYTGCGNGTLVAVQNASYEQQVFDQVNQQRALVGAAPLKRVTALDNAARYQSADLAQDNYFDHNSYDRVNGNLVYVCAWSTRVASFYPSPGGENIAGGYGTPDAVMAGWMGSPGHKANILNTGYWEIGVGYYQGGGQYGVYWTQDFGRRSGIYPLLINSDQASTPSRSVTIYIYGSWTQMRLHNDNDPPGAWVPFKNSSSWQLDHGNGTHTVTAELTNGTTNATSSDTIQLTGDKTPVLAGLPASTGFIYSISDHKLLPAHLVFNPYDSSLGLPVTWSIAPQGSWFNAAPAGGTSPQPFTITPGTFDQTKPGAYTGSVTLSVSSPIGMVNAPFTVNLTLNVVAGPLIYSYLPFTGR